MFRNYFKTAFRNLVRNKNYTIINITGLAIGIAVCMIIFIVIQFYSSFDNFHTKKASIYRVLTEYHHGDSKFKSKAVPFGVPLGIKTALTQIEQIAPILASRDNQVVILDKNNKTDKKFKEHTGLFYTTDAFFKIFDFPLLSGSYESLNNPNSVLLSRETAEKYFGDWNNALGKMIRIDNLSIVKVTGILAPLPANTDFQFKLVVSYGTGKTKELIQSTDYNGTDATFGCFIILPKNITAATFDRQIRDWSKKVKEANNKDEQTIQPLEDVHYDTEAGSYSGKTISHTMVSVLWLIAAFILLIACVNFINLSTAQAVNRAKEVGVRKVLGSSKWQLQLQFLTETFLITLSAIILTLAISWNAIGPVGKILGLTLQINGTNLLSIALFLSSTCILVTLTAGIYPSLVLSAFNPINALKSKLSAKSTKGISLRKGLVVFQFVIAQILIIGTLIIVKQMSFFTSQPLGFDKDAIVNVPLPTDSISNTKLNYLKQQLHTINGIQSASFTSNTPIEDNQDNWTMFVYDHAPKQVDFWSIIKTADNDYVPVYNLPLVAGRNLQPSDTVKEFLVNEMFVHNLHLKNPNDVLGKELGLGDREKGTIVGVLKNFNTRSFRDSLASLVITSYRANYDEASIKVHTKDVKPIMTSFEKIWNQTYPDFVFEYKFLDEKIEEFYKQESQLGYLYRIFAGIAIFLSCLGLYGLASFMAVQRIKEVGIRKVLGATASNIVYLFSREFVILIAIALIIATPLAWYFMHKWLENFAYRIDLTWWIFLVGGMVSVVIALISVGFQAIKAAVANPVKSLRAE